MNVGARFETCSQLCNQRCLNKSAFVVTRLVPRVWKENVHAVQGRQWQHVVDHLYSIMLQNSNVVNVLLANAFEQCAYAGFMYFAA